MSFKISWDAKYKTGVDIIDNQHKVLFDLANDLTQAADRSINHQVLKTLFSVIINYAFSHFATEEELLKDHPALIEHSREHYELIKQLHKFSLEFQNNRTRANHPGAFLYHWLIDHIEHSDIPTFKTAAVDREEIDEVEIFEIIDDIAQERRTVRRLDTELFTNMELNGRWFNANMSKRGRAIIKNISDGGIQFYCKTEHLVDDIVYIDCTIGRSFRILEKLTIKHRDSKGNYGAKFIAPKKETLHFIRTLHTSIGVTRTT